MYHFLIVSFVRDNKIYAVCAIGNLVVYLIAFAIDQELSIGNIVIHYQDLYYYVMLIIGYMILAKCIKKRMIYKMKEDMLQGERISKYRKHFCSKTQTTDHQSSDHKKIAFYRTKRKLTKFMDGNLSIQLKKLESWEYVKSEKKLMNGKAVTQYEITEMGIQQFEEYVDFWNL
mgnify:CR=1 FL=1